MSALRISKKVRRIAVWERDGRMCWLCGCSIKFRDMTIDHVIPVSKGGTMALVNLRAAHRVCNMRRGDNDGPVMRESRRIKRRRLAAERAAARPHEPPQ